MSSENDEEMATRMIGFANHLTLIACVHIPQEVGADLQVS